MKFAALVAVCSLPCIRRLGRQPGLSRERRPRHLLGQRLGQTPSRARPTASLSTVNGDVRVGRGAIADEAKTVNGEIEARRRREGRRSAARSTDRCDIGDGAAVDTRQPRPSTASVELGNARTRRRRRHDGVRRNRTRRRRSRGHGSITRNGDIDLTDGARVRGGIHVKKKNDSNWGWGKDDPIKVHICGTCVVDGELRFDRPVELRVDSGAKIGKVIGDKVTRR